MSATELMDTHEVMRRIHDQRRQRYPNMVPGVVGAGSAPCRLDGRWLRVAFAAAEPGSAPRLVGEVLEYAAAHRFEVYWNVIPARPGEEELLPALEAHGFRQEEGQRLLAHQGPLDAHPNPRVTIAPITSWNAMVVYERGSRGAFFDDPHPSAAVVERRAQERLQEQQQGWCRYFATYLDKRPVGGCYYTRWEDVPTIMGVYTLPYAQRHGVATALLAHVVAALLEAHHETCCLYVRHGNPAEQLYRQLGFVGLLDEYTLVHTA